MLRYCLSEMRHDVQITNLERETWHPDGIKLRIGTVHVFGALVGADEEPFIAACDTNDTVQKTVLDYVFGSPYEAPKDIANAIETDDPKLQAVIDAGLMPMLSMTVVLREAEALNRVPFLISEDKAEQSAHQAKQANTYQTIKDRGVRPLGPEEIVGLMHAHIRTTAAQLEALPDNK